MGGAVIPWCAPAVAEPAPPSDYRSYLDQARFFVKKGWIGDAREQLELAVATEDGRLDPEAWMLLAKVAYEGFDLGRARFAADRALVQSRTPEQATQAGELLSWFDSQFGVVTVSGAQDGTTSRLRLELVSLQLDPDLKAWIDAVARQVGKPVVLPYVLGLPAGEYRINGAPFTVTAGQPTRVAARTGAVDLRQVGLDLGVGATGTAGARAGGLLPAPTVELGVAVPVGPFEVGGGATVGLQPHRTPTTPVAAGPSASGSVHLGWVVPGTGPFLLRPALLGEVARTPGFGTPCADRGDGTFTCALDATSRQLYVFAPAWSAGGGAEVVGLWHDRRRPRSLGVGIRLAATARAAVLPADGTVDVGGVRAWTLSEDDRRFVLASGRASVVLRFGL